MLDEASGVPEDVWEAAETLITSPGSRLAAVGNPTRLATSFHRAFTTERDQYATLQISALDSPPVTGEVMDPRALARLVGPDWIESRRKAWGERSPLWQCRVLGDFPSTTDDTVCALGDVEAAQDREFNRVGRSCSRSTWRGSAPTRRSSAFVVGTSPGSPRCTAAAI